jgi:hypothetical protein
MASSRSQTNNTRRQPCPNNKIHRKAYTRKNGVHVHSTCVSPSSPVNVRTHSKLPHCPNSQIPRAAYVRKITNKVRREGYLRRTKTGKIVRIFPKSKSTYVPASCIHNVGAKGKLPANAPRIGPLRKGELKKHGYSYKLPEEVRRTALTKAIG